MPAVPSGFWLAHPVATTFFVTSRFNDPRNYPNAPDKKQRHEGIDLNAIDSAGRPVAVKAAQRGMVDKVANFPPGYGRYVRIRHAWPDGHVYVTWYGHLSDIHVREGDFVQAGQQIGVAGDTGNAFGIHLHLTLQRLGSGLPGYVVDDVIDPEPFFHFGAPPETHELLFLGDETVPDGTILRPGQAFPKTWRIRNSGTKSWGNGFELAFFAEESLGGPPGVPLPRLKPGEEGLVTVPLVAPERSGRHRSAWKPRDPQGNFFEFELFAEIVVGSTRQDGATFLSDVTIPDGTEIPAGNAFLKTWRARNSGNTTWTGDYRLAFFEGNALGAPESVAVPFTRPGQEAELSVTLQAPAPPGSYQSTWRLRDRAGQFFGDVFFALIQVRRAPDPVALVDEMRFVDDVTFEDGTLVLPGQAFEKIWRVRNSGTSTWGTGYELAFFADDRMGGPEAVPLPEAAPGQTVDIVLPLTAPRAPGRHRSTWKGRSPDGDFFEFEMFVEINVARQASPGIRLDDAKFVKDVTVPDGKVMQAGVPFLKTWRLRNTGTTTWGPGYVLAFLKDEKLGADSEVPLPPAAPGQEANVSVRLTAPLNPGEFRSTWRPRGPGGAFFGHEFFALINVPAPAPTRGLRPVAQLVEHQTLPPGSLVDGGQALAKVWRVKNTGPVAWGDGFSLVHVEGAGFGAGESVPIPATEPLKTSRLALELLMPAAAGRHRGVWKLRDPQGHFFGPQLIVSVTVR